MKPISAIIICLLFLAAGCNSDGGGGADESIPGAGDEDYTTSAYAPVFKMWEVFEKPFADADKTGQEDSNMCWAASAANVLAWAGWAADEDDAFEIFKAHFENEPGYVYDALRYYFNAYVAAGDAAMVTVRESRSYLSLDFIVSALHEGKGVVINIDYPGRSIGHFLTVYGYQYLLEEDNFVLYFTDSDNHRHQMEALKMEWNDAADRWEAHGPYSGWYLDYAVSLALN